jgi:hypothetical protein
VGERRRGRGIMREVIGRGVEDDTNKRVPLVSAKKRRRGRESVAGGLPLLSWSGWPNWAAAIFLF